VAAQIFFMFVTCFSVFVGIQSPFSMSQRLTRLNVTDAC